jgi:arylsulfatase
VPYIYSIDETLDIGEDRGTPILEDYADRMPFKFGAGGRLASTQMLGQRYSRSGTSFFQTFS